MNYTTRSDIPEDFKWDLTPLYPDTPSWGKHRVELQERLLLITQYSGRLGESAAILREALDLYYNTLRELERLYTYAHLMSDEDTGNTVNLALLDQGSNLYTRFSAAAAFISPELLSLPTERIEELLNDELLAPYARVIRETVRYKPHTLSEPEEQLLAQGSEVFGIPGRVFSQLNNADLNFGSIEIDGKPTPLTHGSFILFLKNTNRQIRETAWRQFYSVYEAHKNTIAATLSGSMKRDVFLSRVKRYPSALEGSLFHDNMPKAVYTNLISTVHENLPVFHRYLKLRKKLLKLETQAPWDLYLPLVPDVKLRHTFPEAADCVVDSLAPLGEEYCTVLRDGLHKGRWADVYETKGKRSGAYSSGCYDSPPYMLLNHKDEELGDLFTLTHEAGHSMHTYFANRAQPYQDHGYTIFVAEVASTFNEQLLLKHLRSKYSARPEVVRYLISHQLDEIRNTLIRQTMFAEFELLTHARLEANEPLTVAELRSIYSSLLERYFGDEVERPEETSLECLRIPHFYSPFYVYKYSTGIAAAIALSDGIDAPGAKDRYLNFLRTGGSQYPLEQLKTAGVDMLSPEPIARAFKVFERLVEELE